MADVMMTRAEYEALLSWARLGAEEAGQYAAYLERRHAVDVANGLQRYTLVLRYDALPEQSLAASLEGGLAVGPYVKVLELWRKPTPEDVAAAMATVPHIAGSLLITADPLGAVGWYEVDKFPWG